VEKVELFLIHSKFLQFLHTDSFQRPLIRRLEHNLRHLFIVRACPGIKCFFPSIHAQTPFATLREAGLAEIVTTTCRKIEKLICDDGYQIRQFDEGKKEMSGNRQNWRDKPAME
jgi:hypothetical protein